MKTICKFVSFIIMFCFTTSLHAQLPEEIQWKHIIKTYTADSTQLVLSLNNKLLEGQYKIPLDGTSFALYTIKKGMISNEAFWYKNSGNLECKLNYKKGVRNGLKENFDNDGAVWLKQYYKDGKLDGISEMYSNGRITSKTSYKAGKKNGLSTSYSGNQVISEANYKDNKRNGTSKTYFNGLLMTENNYVDDLQDGLSIMYNQGKKNMDATYHKGQRHGLSHMYKPDGAVLFESYFLLGEKVSKEIFEKYNTATKKDKEDK